jgi:hypothetical protein
MTGGLVGVTEKSKNEEKAVPSFVSWRVARVKR